MVDIRRITAEALPALTKLAQEDQHMAVLPTHVILKHDQIVGCMSIGAVPVMIPWFSTKMMNVRDTFVAKQVFENLMFAGGARIIMVPCNHDSPLYPFMQKDGYLPVMEGTMFTKQLE